MDSLSELLINLLVIVVSMLFIHFWMNKRNINKLQFELVVFFSLGIAIVLCMQFPFTFSDGFMFDLRLIPFLLACLYANPITAAILAMVVVLIRILHGGDGVWITMITLPSLSILCIIVRPIFKRARISIKLLITVLMIGLASIGILAFIKFVNNYYIPNLFSILFIGIHMLGMCLATYMSETFRTHYMLLNRLIRMEKVEVVSHLAASISHEVRNPLTSSRGFVQLVYESNDIPDQEKGYLKIALSEMDRAETIISDYLTFAKPTTNKIEKLSITTLIKDAVQIMHPYANVNNVKIVTHLSNSWIMGNIGLFQQMMINILKNGIEAMPNGGEIVINAFNKSDSVHIVIIDQGVGMNIIQKSRLGEPYFSTKETKGTGLGMMVVFRVVESMNGTIHIDSEVGKGTIINLSFSRLNSE